MKNRKTKAAITLALSASGLMMTPLLAVADEPSTPDDSVANVPSAHQADLPGESGEVTPAPEPPSAPSEPSPSPSVPSVPQPAPVNIVERIVPLPAAPVDWGAANTPSAPGGREGTLTLPVTGAPAAPASAGTSSGLNRVAPSSSQLPVQELAKTGADDPWHGAWLAGGLIGLGTIMIRRAHTAPVAAAPRRRGKHAM